MTRDSPHANHFSPSIFSCVRIVLVTSPKTTEVFTPPFSKTFPPLMTLVFPPPPSGLSHLSSMNFALPSTSSRASQIRFCRSCMYSIQDSLMFILPYFLQPILLATLSFLGMTMQE